MVETRSPAGLVDTPIVQYRLGDIDVNSFSIFEYFEYTDSISTTANPHRMVMFDTDSDTIEKETIFKGNDNISFEFGWADGDISGTINARVIELAPVFTTEGVSLHVIGADLSLFINRGVKSRAFANKTVSDVVRQIAAEHGSRDPVIEATSGALTLRQFQESDIQFIKNRLLRRAVSASSKRGDYNFYLDRNNEFHFHTPDYTTKIYDTYTFGNTDQFNVISFSTRFNGELVNALGGLDINATGYDSNEKRELRVQINNAKTPEKELLGNKTTLTDLPTGAQFGRYYPVPFQNQSEVEAWARSHWYMAQRVRNTARMEVIGDPNLQAGNQIEVKVVNVNSTLHYASGRYLVETAKHIIQRGKGYRTHLILSRNGGQAGDEDLIGVRRALNIQVSSVDQVQKVAETIV